MMKAFVRLLLLLMLIVSIANAVFVPIIIGIFFKTSTPYKMLAAATLLFLFGAVNHIWSWVGVLALLVSGIFLLWMAVAILIGLLITVIRKDIVLYPL